MLHYRKTQKISLCSSGPVITDVPWKAERMQKQNVVIKLKRYQIIELEHTHEILVVEMEVKLGEQINPISQAKNGFRMMNL